MKFDLTIPCLFGLEGLVADELRMMGLEDVTADTGKVGFKGGIRDIATVNINLRTGERVLLLMGEFEAKSFDSLFEGVKALPWEEFITRNSAFPVKGHSLNSALHSIPDCQRIIKKAIVTRLASKYHISQFPETGPTCQVRFNIIGDRASLYLDTSGTALHKRGYRPNANQAPLRETLAAAIVKLSRFKGRQVFIDPFCGSGTIAIEAALAALNRAPGLNRRFASEDWPQLGKLWDPIREEAKAKEFSGKYEIIGSDIAPASIDIAKENARRAGVADIVKFSVADAFSLTLPEGPGILASNPPYGERILDIKEAELIYRRMGKLFYGHDGWSLYILSSNPDFEKHFGKTAKKRRKLYNGMIQCQLYMYFQ